MKFSSIYLIAAAATAGSAIAAPGPLHARALAIENLFKRQPTGGAAPIQSKQVASLLEQSADAHHSAASAAYTTSQGKTKTLGPNFWKEQSEKYTEVGDMHGFLSGLHEAGHYKGDQAMLDDHADKAIRGIHDAEKTKKHAIADRK